MALAPVAVLHLAAEAVVAAAAAPAVVLDADRARLGCAGCHSAWHGHRTLRQAPCSLSAHNNSHACARAPRLQADAEGGDAACSGLQLVVLNLPWSVSWQTLKARSSVVPGSGGWVAFVEGGEDAGIARGIRTAAAGGRVRGRCPVRDFASTV